MPPAFHRLFPQLALWRVGAALDVFDGFVVHRHETHPGACFDGHVAHRHAPFHGEIADRLAAELDGIAGAAGGADTADDSQHDVLGGDAGAHMAAHFDEHRLRLLLDQALGGQHVLHLGSADAEGQGAEGAVGGGVGVAADHRHSRQGGALFRPHHMDDPLTGVVDVEFGNGEGFAILVEGHHLKPRDRVVDRFHPAMAVFGHRGHVVVGGGQVGPRPPRLAPGQPQPLEGLGRGHFVDQVAVDVEQAGAVLVGAHHMIVPQFVVECSRLHGALLVEATGRRSRP